MCYKKFFQGIVIYRSIPIFYPHLFETRFIFIGWISPLLKHTLFFEWKKKLICKKGFTVQRLVLRSLYIPGSSFWYEPPLTPLRHGCSRPLLLRLLGYSFLRACRRLTWPFPLGCSTAHYRLRGCLTVLILDALHTLGLRQFYLPTNWLSQLVLEWSGTALHKFGIYAKLH